MKSRFLSSGQNEIGGIPRSLAAGIVNFKGFLYSLQDCFTGLEQTPADWKQPHIKRLRGRLSGLWRYRIGNLRVIYRIDEDAGVVYVVNIGPRGDIY